MDQQLDFEKLRVGIGHDTHRLVPGGPLKIGGTEIAHPQHLSGHSDADVLLHAITDAILGASAQGDIGELFPDTNAEHAGRDSTEMLRLAAGKVQAAGFKIINIDCIVFAQQPKLSPYKRQIREHIASTLEIALDCVGLKAKTGEGVDAVGEQLAIQAQCIALLVYS